MFRRTTIIVVAIAFAYMLFWDIYAYARYISYTSTYFDIGLADYNLYYYSVQHVSPMQFFVFMNHISFFFPVVFAFYKLFGNPFSFIWLQNLFLAATIPLLYLIGKIRSERLGLALAIAFAINPAFFGLGVFDAHLEGILPFFYMLSIYYYLKESRLFVLSFLILLAIIDTGAALAFALALALLVDQLIKRKKSSKKMLAMLILCLLLAILFIFAYWGISANIKSNVPPQLKAMNFFGEQKNAIVGTSNRIGISSLLWLFGAFFSFGITSIFALLQTIIMLSPWLAEVFMVKNTLFITPYMQYFAYAIGGLGGTALGLHRLKIGVKKERIIEASIYIFAMLFAVLFILAYGFPIPGKAQAISIPSAIENSSIMAQGSITPHLYNMLYVENPPDEKPLWFEPLNYTTYWFKPKYIVFDRELNDYGPMNSSSFNIFAYMGNNYTLYMRNGSLEIYVLKNKQSG
ncbi:MAG: DUF2079 domain-containing protein [Candidatus Micrarchaeia archaeon]